MSATITPGRLTKTQARKAQAIASAQALEDARRDRDAELDFLYGFEDASENVGDLGDLLLDMLAFVAADKADELLEEYGRAQALAIERLRLAQASAKAVAASNDPVQMPGMYRKDGKIYRVQKSRQSGFLYAKLLNPENRCFEYAAGAMRELCESDRMTLEEAKAFGVETGVCCVCAALLTDPKSIAAGIGPICAKRV